MYLVEPVGCIIDPKGPSNIIHHGSYEYIMLFFELVGFNQHFLAAQKDDGV